MDNQLNIWNKCSREMLIMVSRSNKHSKVSLVCPRYKRESEGGRSFGVIGSKLWNIMPADIRSNDSF